MTDKDKVDYASSGVDIDLEGKVNSLVSELNSPPRLPGEIGSLIDHPGGFMVSLTLVMNCLQCVLMVWVVNSC